VDFSGTYDDSAVIWREKHARPCVPVPQAPLGHTLLELTAALSVSAVATAGLLVALAELERGARVFAAQQRAVVALEHGRRSSYLTASSVGVTAVAGAEGFVVIGDDGERHEIALPAGTSVSAAPVRGAARFFASGFADNATFELGLAGRPMARVVVDQRGEIE
jgi:hypothetical protein